MLHRSARDAYSWWWASHIRTKQSKWLDQNLQDMEEKVEYILKIINQDGDSFAVRAEMYYRKRPELVNFIEDCFRGYRALAERYDHLSRDFQSANRTIAAVYSETLQLSMDQEVQEEEEIIYHAGKLNLPKSFNPHKKKPTELGKTGSNNERLVTRSSSGLSKAEAIQEMDKLQKGILGLQTEKEFIKSSYENALTIFWEIENRITEMQARVCSLQDEFGVGRVIEDDEARILMTTTALKSCHETLGKLQEKHAQTNEEARIEHQRIQEAWEKFESIKEGTMKGLTNEQENIEESTKQETVKANEQLLPGAAPIAISEFAEKIDELVDKVISLETEVVSQALLVERLRLEANEVYFHLKSSEEEGVIGIECFDNKSRKIRKLEEVLKRVQSFNQKVQVQNQSLQTQFLIASSTIDKLSEGLLNVKSDKEVESTESSEEVEAGQGENVLHQLPAAEKKKDEKEIATNEEVTLMEFNVGADSGVGYFSNHHTSQESESLVPSIPFNHLDNHTKDASEDKQEKSFIKPEEGGAHCNSMISEGEAKAKKADVSSCNFLINTAEPYQSIQHKTISKEGLVIDVSQDRREDGLKVEEDLESREMSFLGDPPVKAQEENSVQSTLLNHLDNLFLQSETRPVIDANLEEAFSPTVDINTPDIGSVVPNHGQSSSTNAGAGSWYVSHPSNPFDDLYGIAGSWNNAIIGQKNIDHFLDSAPTKAQVSSQLDHLVEESQQVKGRVEDNSPEFLEELNTYEEGEPNWRHLFMYGLEDREKMLLEEYTVTLRNYKQVKKELSEVEKRNHVKDAEIQSLHQKLNLFQTNIDETPELSTFEKENEEGEIKKNPRDETPLYLGIKEKIRMDIDDMVEENIELWLRFTTALHQIQKFQTVFHDLKMKLKGVKENKKQDGSQSKQDQSEIRPLYKHLQDILAEVTLWWENTAVLEDDLENRSSSLSNILREIAKISSNGEKKEDGSELSDYQSAKFQGEVMNMQQEYKKVADELRAGINRVKRLQIDIEKTLIKLDDELEKSQQTKSSSSRSKIPLKFFLSGVKLKKQKPSVFACMNPAFQKQYSDLSALHL